VADWLAWGYWGVFLLMMLENVIPPIPSEAIMGLGGVAVAQGRLAFVPLLIVGTAGSVFGNLFWWELCRRLGYERFRPFVDRWGRLLTLEWEDVEKIHAYFDRWGGPTVLVFRFLPIGRTVISIPAGLMHMPLWRFVLFTAIGSLVWNTLLIAAGMGLAASIKDIEHWLMPIAIGVLVLAVLAYLWRVLTWKPRAKR
jgi:membrane protein DedA with SNARE-associated domain